MSVFGWKAFLNDPPGERFARRHAQRRQRRQNESPLKQLLLVVTALLLIVAGMVLWLLPGSGWLLIFIALMILAGRSGRIARWLDSTELWGRRQIKKFRQRRKSGGGEE